MRNNALRQRPRERRGLQSVRPAPGPLREVAVSQAPRLHRTGGVPLPPCQKREISTTRVAEEIR